MTRGTPELPRDAHIHSLALGERARVRAGQTTKMRLAETGRFGFNPAVPKADVCNPNKGFP